jgi:hypothetical protein
VNYGLLFWGSSTESIKIFKLQKKMRIIMGYKSNYSCRELFVALGIFPLYSQYIFSLLLFLNKNQFQVNSEIYHNSTRQKSHLHQPSANLTKYQKGVYYLGVKVFNKLPTYIYHYSTRQNSHLHQPSANLIKYQKGVYYLGFKVFNRLPTYIKEESDNAKKFLKKFTEIFE